MLGIHIMSYRLLANGHIHTSKVTPITLPHCVINVLTIPHLYRLRCYDKTGNQNLARRHEYITDRQGLIQPSFTPDRTFTILV
ncbi:hypothetical protein L873DRAFT_1819190, partial [Choiromyces venosus 120613-1]